MNVKISKWGETTLSPSLAISFEFVISWTNAGEDLAQIARITAGAIGIAYPHKLPKYRAAVHQWEEDRDPPKKKPPRKRIAAAAAGGTALPRTAGNNAFAQDYNTVPLRFVLP